MNARHPFAAVPTDRSILMTDARREALSQLDEGLGTREPFLLVTGDSGTGKTTLVHEAVARWGSRATVAFLTNPALTRTELVEEIARRFGSEPPAGASKPQLLACLERALVEAAKRGQVPVLVVKDAHDVGRELLEELRVLVNAEAQAGRPLEVVLVGLPHLDARLARPEFASIRQRIAAHCHLEPLSLKETRHYLHHRVNAVGGNGPALFPRKTCSEVHTRARGIPRAVNTLAAEAMRRARDSGSAVVSPEHVRAAAGALWTGATTSTQAVGVDEAQLPDGVGEAGESLPPISAPPESQEAPSAHLDEPPVEDVAMQSAAQSHPADPADLESPPPDAGSSESRTPDPRVSAWVEKFIGNQGPPRIGVRLRAEPLEEADRALSALGAEAGDAAPGAGLALSPEREARLAAARRPSPRRPRERRRRTSRLVAPLAVSGIVLAGIATAFVLPRGRELMARVSTRKVASTRQAAKAPIPSPAVIGDSAQSLVNAAIPSSASSEPMTAAVETAGGAGKADSTSTPRGYARLTLDVASYFDEERAAAERDRLAAASGLQGWVVGVTEGGIASHHVLLGIFRVRERAETMAATIWNRGLVTKALVVPLPPRRSRH